MSSFIPSVGLPALLRPERANGFYKLSSKYLGMLNISAAAGIPVHTLFMS